MTDEDDRAAFRAQVRPLAEALQTLVEAERAIRQRRHLLPAAESDAMAEIAGGQSLVGRSPWGDSAVQDAYSMVTALLFAAEDHILATCRLFEDGPNPVYAHLSRLRVAFETCLIARWMLEGERGTARNRIGRYMNCRLDDLIEREKVVKMMSVAEATKAREWYVTILEEGQRLGFEMRTNRHGNVFDFDPPLPNTVDLGEGFLLHDDDGTAHAPDVGVMLRRYYSGVTHSKWYALRQAVEEASVAPDTTTPGTTTVNYVTRSRDVLMALAVSAIAYMPACGTLHSRMGWNEPDDTTASDLLARMALFPPQE